MKKTVIPKAVLLIQVIQAADLRTELPAEVSIQTANQSGSFPVPNFDYSVDNFDVTQEVFSQLSFDETVGV